MLQVQLKNRTDNEEWFDVVHIDHLEVSYIHNGSVWRTSIRNIIAASDKTDELLSEVEDWLSAINSSLNPR